MNYVLDVNGDPVAESNLLKWAEWFEGADLKLALDVIERVKVSTVFLGTDHAFDGGPPMLYETMVFGGMHDKYQELYHDKVDALAGHDRTVVLVKKGHMT